MTTTDGRPAATITETDSVRVLHTGAAIGDSPHFVNWAQELYGPELLHAADLSAALKLLRDQPVDLVLVQLETRETPRAQAFRALAPELPGIPLVGALKDGATLGHAELLELQVAGMSAYVRIGREDADTARLLRALAGRRSGVRHELERHRRAMQQLARFENWSARSTKRLDEWVHDLRTPLGVIRGFVGNLLDGVYGEVGPAQREIVDKVRAASELLRGLIDQVRSDLPSPPEMDDDLRPQRIVGRTQLSLEEICEEVAEFLGSAARAAGAELLLEKKACPLVWGNRMRVIQALVNLVKNACRFTPAGGRITLSVAPLAPTEDEPWARCEVGVADTGPGISPEDQERIFEAGYTTGGEDGHQGMGLAVVREVVKEHGGRLALESRPSLGTRFRVILPVDPRRRQRRTKVYVLRDPDFVQRLLGDLRRTGARIETVAAAAHLEELGKQLRAGGQELLVVDPERLLPIDGAGGLAQGTALERED